MYLLDTDHLGILQLREGELFASLRAKLDQHDRDEFFVSVVSVHEQMNGWQAYLRRQRSSEQVVWAYRQFERVLLEFTHWQIASFDLDAAIRFQSLRKQRIRVATMDLRIAATALMRNFTVLTRNLVDFEKVPGLRVEDWTTSTSDKPR